MKKYQSQLLLFLKPLVFGSALLLVSWRDFGIIPILLFSSVSLIMYARPILSATYYTWSAFFALLFASVLGMKILTGTALFLPGLALYSFIFYLILGIKDYFFVKRSRLYYISALLIFYSLFIEFFLADKSQFFLLKYSGMILVLFLLFREWLSIIPSFHFPKRETVAAAVAALVGAQFLWAIALLPIGFISSANLMILLVFTMADFLLKHFTGGISKEFLIQHLFFFLVLSSLIFWTSNWGLGI